MLFHTNRVLTSLSKIVVATGSGWRRCRAWQKSRNLIDSPTATESAVLDEQSGSPTFHGSVCGGCDCPSSPRAVGKDNERYGQRRVRRGPLSLFTTRQAVVEGN